MIGPRFATVRQVLWHVFIQTRCEVGYLVIEDGPVCHPADIRTQLVVHHSETSTSERQVVLLDVDKKFVGSLAIGEEVEERRMNNAYGRRGVRG
jgi:hypothetical protein